MTIATKGGRKRHGRYSLQERIWYWLRKRPGSKMLDCMEHFDITRSSASQTLCRLVDKGCATRKGGSCAARYTATEVYPDDLRGTAVGSQRVLQAKIAARRAKRKPRRIQRKHGASTLARVWPLIAEVRT